MCTVHRAIMVLGKFVTATSYPCGRRTLTFYRGRSWSLHSGVAATPTQQSVKTRQDVKLHERHHIVKDLVFGNCCLLYRLLEGITRPLLKAPLLVVSRKTLPHQLSKRTIQAGHLYTDTQPLRIYARD
jgi:hypothetical protein